MSGVNLIFMLSHNQGGSHLIPGFHSMHVVLVNVGQVAYERVSITSFFVNISAAFFLCICVC